MHDCAARGSGGKILLRFGLGKGWERGLNKVHQVVPVVHVCDVEIVFGSVIGRAKNDFFQQGPPGVGYLEIEFVVADEAEQDAITVDAIVPHHLFHGDITGAGTLVCYVLDKVWIRGHDQMDSRFFLA